MGHRPTREIDKPFRSRKAAVEERQRILTERQKAKHAVLVELCNDYLQDGGKLLSKATVMELVQWSHQQTQSPQ